MVTGTCMFLAHNKLRAPTRSGAVLFAAAFGAVGAVRSFRGCRDCPGLSGLSGCQGCPGLVGAVMGGHKWAIERAVERAIARVIGLLIERLGLCCGLGG